MRGSHLRALRRTTAMFLAAAVYTACAPVDTVSNVGDGGAAGASSSGHGGSSGAAGATNTAGTTGSGGTSGAGGTIGPGVAGADGGSSGAAGHGGTSGSGGEVGAAGKGGAGAAGGSGGAGARGGGGGAAGRGGTGGRGGAAGGGAGVAGATGTGGAFPPLKKYVGNIDTRGQIRSDFTMYWDQVTPENAGKWGSIEGTRNQMNWSTLDKFYAYAKQNNITFKQHNFIWGSQQPGWIGGLSQADQKAEVEEWIRLYCERYPDTPLIDVVNEPPPHTTPPYVAALGGAGSSGYDWIAQAFKWAHQYCPNSILILNDYNNIEYSSDNAHTIDIVTKIKAAGAPITGVGAQCHACSNVSVSTLQANIDKITAQTGLPVYISEYDINIADDNQQKSVMQSQFTMFWNDKNVAGITLWGYIVGSTWETNSGLMSSSGTLRPAMSWLMDFLGR
jgi:endo-1,4-beta-xylanase